MADLKASFALTLEDALSPGAKSAKASIDSLSNSLKSAKAQLSGYESQLALASKLGDVEGYRRYSALIGESRKKVFDLAQTLDGMPSRLGEGSASAGTMGLALGAVGIAAGVATVAIGGLVSVTESLVVKSLEVVGANRIMAAQFEAMGNAGSGKKTLAMVDDLAKRLPQSREQIAKWTQQIEKMGVTDLGKVRSELMATASAEAILGEGGAAAYDKISRKVHDAIDAHHALKIASKELTRTIGTGLASATAEKMGLSLGQLETKLKAGTVDAQKFGDALNSVLVSRGKGPLDAMSNGLDAIKRKGAEAIGHLFDDIDTKPLTDGLRSVVGLLDQSQPSGQAMKMGLTGAMNAVIRVIGHAITEGEVFFLDLEIGALKTYIAFKPLIGAVEKISSGMRGLGAFRDKLMAPVDKADAGADKALGVKAGTSADIKGLFSINPFTQLKSVFDLTIGSLADAKAQEVARAQGMAVGKAAIEGVRAGTQTHSPSVAAMRIGADIGAGLGLGMVSSPMPARAARTISGNALGGLQAGAGGALGGGGAANSNNSIGPIHIAITAPEGVTDAHAISVVGLATALERYQIGSGR